jgi:segregation and condensation protein B
MDLVDTLEALLFVADAPVPLNTLATSLQLTEGQVEQALEVLGARMSGKGALQLIEIAGGYQLCTKPEFAEPIAAFLKPQRQRLTRSLMEVLAIVAYKQPITQAEIDAVRGVQSDYGVRSLLEKRLVQEVGRKQTPGRPFMYGTTQQFLHHFNLNDLQELPAISAGLPVLQVEEGGLAEVK